VVVEVIVAAVVAASAAAYLTGFIIIGDPFSGTWRLNPDDPNYAVVIKQTRAGYYFAVANGKSRPPSN
jgi:hypothetical protein